MVLTLRIELLNQTEFAMPEPHDAPEKYTNREDLRFQCNTIENYCYKKNGLITTKPNHILKNT